MTTGESLKLFDRYMTARNFSEATRKTYMDIVTRFLFAHKVDPKKIRSHNVWEYTNAINSPRTRNQTIGCLKTFFKVCGMPRVVNVPYAKVPHKHPVFISKERFEQGMSECGNSKHRLIFRLMFNHGLRVGEVIACKIGWFGSQTVDGKKHYTLTVAGKGSKDRLLWLSNETTTELRKYATGSGIDLTNRSAYLFSGQSSDRYTESSIRQLTKRYFGVHPHALRHSCATELVNRDINQRKIQSLLGHSSGKTTEIYTHISIAPMIGVAA